MPRFFLQPENDGNTWLRASMVSELEEEADRTGRRHCELTASLLCRTAGLQPSDPWH